MAVLIFVVIASVAMFFVAQQHATDLVTDDYYKDGKHIDIQLHRDEEAVRRHIGVQVLISPDMNAAKVFVGGEFDGKQPLNLLLMHPTRKADDQTVALKPVGSAQNGRAEYEAVFKTLPVNATTGMCAWRTRQACGASRTNGLPARAMRSI